MKVMINRDAEHVKAIREALEANDNYCPCQIRSEDTQCMCKSFRDLLNDPDFYGFCHCGLYEKVKDGSEVWL